MKREIIELTHLAHYLNPNLKFIVITGNTESPLAKEANVQQKPEEVCIIANTTTSTTTMTVIGDLLVVQTMKQTGFSTEDYAKRHHGGYLGENREVYRKVIGVGETILCAFKDNQPVAAVPVVL